MSSFLPASSDWVYLDNNGQVGLEILNDRDASPTYINTNGTVNSSPGPYSQAPDYVQMFLYADGGQLILTYADNGPFVHFGPGNQFTHGTLTSYQYSASDAALSSNYGETVLDWETLTYDGAALVVQRQFDADRQ